MEGGRDGGRRERNTLCQISKITILGNFVETIFTDEGF